MKKFLSVFSATLMFFCTALQLFFAIQSAIEIFNIPPLISYHIKEAYPIVYVLNATGLVLTAVVCILYGISVLKQSQKLAIAATFTAIFTNCIYLRVKHILNLSLIYRIPNEALTGNADFIMQISLIAYYLIMYASILVLFILMKKTVNKAILVLLAIIPVIMYLPIVCISVYDGLIKLTDPILFITDHTFEAMYLIALICMLFSFMTGLSQQSTTKIVHSGKGGKKALATVSKQDSQAQQQPDINRVNREAPLKNAPNSPKSAVQPVSNTQNKQQKSNDRQQNANKSPCTNQHTELEKYQKMLSKGEMSFEEFEKVKKEIISR